MKYSVDTSGWLDGWERDYPIDVFPTMWALIDELIEKGEIVSSEEVYVEAEKKSDGLYPWLKERKKKVIYPITDEVQDIVLELLAEHPRLVDTLKNRSQADPFVIATAEHLGAKVVTGEGRTGNLNKPKIPDVCDQRGVECITFLDMLRELGFKF